MLFSADFWLVLGPSLLGTGLGLFLFVAMERRWADLAGASKLDWSCWLTTLLFAAALLWVICFSIVVGTTLAGDASRVVQYVAGSDVGMLFWRMRVIHVMLVMLVLPWPWLVAVALNLAALWRGSDPPRAERAWGS